MQQHALGTPGILFCDIPDVLLGFSRGPWVRGHYSFVWGRLMSSIVFVGDGLVLFDRCIGCFHSKMDDFV